MAPTNTVDFNWTDDEIQLLLEATIQFKCRNEYEGLSWESVKTKYDKITNIVKETYPTSESEKFPNYTNIEEKITKNRIAAKLKKIRTNFRKAVDTGRKSGGGRIVFSFYDLCEKIWGSSPAVNSIPGGIDSSDSQYQSPVSNMTYLLL